MEREWEMRDLLRCAACHALYGPSRSAGDERLAAMCPECGSDAWLAAQIPVAEPPGGLHP